MPELIVTSDELIVSYRRDRRYEDVAGTHPDVVARLVARLEAYQATAVPPLAPDGSCDPIVVQGAWRPCDSP